MAARGKVVSYPAPVGGWNLRDSVDQMELKYAISMINYFPEEGKVSLRKGNSSYATGLTSEVEMLAELRTGSSNKFISAAAGEIWDISSAGAGASLASGFGSNRWQWAQFDDASGGVRMGLVNGTDAPQIYDGSTVSSMTVSGSGLTTSNLVGINIFKSRSYFWESDSANFWYSSVNALGGALTKFPLGRVSAQSGNLVAMSTWTMDGGSGQDDVAVFLMTSGDIFVYQGSDPGSSNDWSLVGIFRSGAPLSIRSSVKLGADLVVMTKDGYLPLSKILGLSRVDKGQGLSDKIDPEVKRVSQAYGSNYGWQAMFYPRGNMALFNVPIGNSTYEQHVMNVRTGAWCKFTGWNARCFGIFNDRLYFGGNGVVYLADNERSDDGDAIIGTVQTAWQYPGGRGFMKKYTASRILYQTNENGTQVTVRSAVDYGSMSTNAVITSSGLETTPWGSPWDSAWSSNSLTTDEWYSMDQIGYSVSTQIQTQTTTQSFDWLAIAYIMEPGGLV